MQEPRLRVAAQGPQALLHVAGLPVQEVQPHRRETARDGRAGESGRPGTGVQPRTLWIKVPPTWASHAGPGFGREAVALAVSAERSKGLVSDPAGRAVRCGVCSAPRIRDPALRRKAAGFAPSGISKLPRISDPALVAALPGALCARDPGARNSASGGELRGWLCRGKVPGIFDPAPGSVAAFGGPRDL